MRGTCTTRPALRVQEAYSHPSDAQRRRKDKHKRMRCPLKHEGYKKTKSAHGERGRRSGLGDAFQIEECLYGVPHREDGKCKGRGVCVRPSANLA